MKSLILAEKPSVGKEIAKVFHCNQKKKGYMEGGKQIITWALGHLVTLADPHEYNNKYREWRLEDLPMLPEKMKLKVIRKTSHQFNVIKNLIKRNDVNQIIIATDAGREGELVARWILKLSGNRHDVKRLWISSQTDRAIREGFANLKPGKDYLNLCQAAICRAEADWLIGLNVTRALTCKFDAQFTAGRVQTPTLAMITEREEEIKNFTPKDYWIIVADFGDYKGMWKDKNGNTRLFSKEKADRITAKVQGKTGTITELKTTTKKEYPPLAYNLAELQRDANRRFGFSAKQTLSLLQGLYERHKIATYPRTDSRHITDDMVPTLGERVKAINTGPYASLVKTLQNKPLSPGKHFVDNRKVSDHHAIIPTEEPVHLDRLTGEERRIHELIVKRFIEILSPPCIYRQTRLVTEVEGESFHTKGKEIIERGFLAVGSPRIKDEDPYDETDDLPEQKLRLSHHDSPGEKAAANKRKIGAQQEKNNTGFLQKGNTRKVRECHSEELKTKPPSRYTEATLLTGMENAGKFIKDKKLKESIKKGGIGTPATRADIIEKLFYNNYVERHGKLIYPTTKGKTLISLVPDQLKSPRLTAEWELRLSNIEQGNEKKSHFIRDIITNTKELVTSIKESTASYTPDNVTNIPCPICGKHMLTFKGKKGKMLVCPDRACGFRKSEKESKGDWFRKSKKERYINKKLIEKYSDNSSDTVSFGDLLKQAMENKKKESE